jgi:ATP-binding cassette subfamily B protein
VKGLLTPTVRRLLTLVGPHRRAFALSILAAFLSIVGGLLLPLASRELVNRGVVAHDRGAVLTWALVFVLLAFVRGYFNYLRRYLTGAVSISIETNLRERLLAHLQGLPVDFHDSWQTGQLLARATGDLNAIRMFLAFGVVFLGILVALVIGTVGVLFALDWPIGLVVLAVAPLILLSAGMFNRKVAEHVEASRELVGDVASTVEESASGIRVLKAFGREDREVARLQAQSDQLWAANVQVARIRSVWVPLLSTLPNLMTGLVLALGGYRVLHHQLDIGAFFAAFQYLGLLGFPLRNAGWILAMAQQADAAGKRVFEVLDTQADVLDGSSELAWSGGRVELRGVTVHTGSGGRPALDGIDLVIEAGDTVALVGPSGSGKSVLASLLWRSRDPDAGEVLVDGTDLRNVTLHSLRSRVGVVFEEAVLFRGDVRANVCFGDPDADDERIDAAARAAGVEEIIPILPEGWQTPVGESGFSLSGGQRQRVALARALLVDPRLLILDDPLSAVDPRTERRIEQALVTAVQGRTTVLIAHRASTISLARRVVVLDQGRIVADGTHAELMQSSELYRSLLASADADAAVVARAGLLLEDVA